MEWEFERNCDRAVEVDLRCKDHERGRKSILIGRFK